MPYCFIDGADPTGAKPFQTGETPSTIKHAMREKVLLNTVGLKGWNYAPTDVSGTTAAVSGTVYYMLLPLLDGDVVTNLIFSSGTVSSVPTITKAVLYKVSDSTIITATNSGDVSSTFSGSTGNKLVPLGAAYTQVGNGCVWAAFIFTGTTGPALARTGNQVTNAVPLIASTPSLCGFQTGQTDFQSTGTISTGVTGLCYWVGWN